MLLLNAHIPGNDRPLSIKIGEGKIVSINAGKDENEQELDCNGYIVFPGLINAHDHLDFNLFPRLGGRTYPNYVAWAKDVNRNKTSAINAVLKIPLQLRTQWGVYKNLLAGVTTVVNHGKPLDIDEELISVCQDNISLHSVRFEKNWRLKLNRPGKSGHTFVMHVGEGTDKLAQKEIDHVNRANLFNRKIVAVHGVAMRPQQASGFRALTWCPQTNLYLLGKTAPIDQLKHHLPIIFGTDSTLTACWNIWEHLRQARELGLLADEELFKSLTEITASALGYEEKGSIEVNKDADIVLAKTNGPASFDNFFSITPEAIMLVMHKGNIRLFGEEIKEQLLSAGFLLDNFSRISVNGKQKYVQGDLPALMNNVRSYYPEASFPVSAIS